jgi:hypothetical protein
LRRLPVSGSAICVYADDASGTLDWASWSSSTGWDLRGDLAIAGKGETASLALVTHDSSSRLLLLLADDAGDLYAALFGGLDWRRKSGPRGRAVQA